jgi:hypothetical protein
VCWFLINASPDLRQRRSKRARSFVLAEDCERCEAVALGHAFKPRHVEILQLVDQDERWRHHRRSRGSLTQTPRDLIARNVTAMLQDLADKGCLADDSSN